MANQTQTRDGLGPDLGSLQTTIDRWKQNDNAQRRSWRTNFWPTTTIKSQDLKQTKTYETVLAIRGAIECCRVWSGCRDCYNTKSDPKHTPQIKLTVPCWTLSTLSWAHCGGSSWWRQSIHLLMSRQRLKLCTTRYPMLPKNDDTVEENESDSYLAWDGKVQCGD